jgi:hypothetical protein
VEHFLRAEMVFVITVISIGFGGMTKVKQAKTSQNKPKFRAEKSATSRTKSVEHASAKRAQSRQVATDRKAQSPISVESKDDQASAPLPFR